MPHFQKIHIALAIISLLVLVACESETETSNQGPCGDPTLHLHEVSFVLNGIKYDLDSLELATATITQTWDDTLPPYEISYTVLGLADSGRILNFQLDIIVPKYESNVYQWVDGTSDTTVTGCYVTIDSVYGTDEKYTPISGSTNIKIYENSGVERDSIFGTFCGTVKNGAGVSVAISDGRFYLSSY